MPRFRMIAALAAAGLAAGAIAIGSANASPIPEDKWVGTWILVPLTNAAGAATPGNDATVQVDWAARKVCYALNAKGLEGGIKAAELRKGAKGQAGTTVAAFKPQPRSGDWAGCVELEGKVAEAILDNPADYFVSVEPASAPGPLRAQLDGPSETLPL